MSQLRKAGKPSIGTLDRQVKLSWSDLVQLALILTVQAYQKMRKDKIARQNWEENVFTVRLGEDYLIPIIFQNQYPIRISIREKVHTKEMKQGIQKTISAKEIDLSLYDVWDKNYLQRRFIWEAKRVGDKRRNIVYENLNSEYVNEAIYRFIKIDYANDLNDAGVLAYVLEGNAADIVFDINQTMGNIRINHPLPLSNHLFPAKSIGGFKDIYNSHHIRTDNTEIVLHHLFFSFDF